MLCFSKYSYIVCISASTVRLCSVSASTVIYRLFQPVQLYHAVFQPVQLHCAVFQPVQLDCAVFQPVQLGGRKGEEEQVCGATVRRLRDDVHTEHYPRRECLPN